MKKFRAAVVGYGNIGKFTVEALEAAPDFEIAGIVRRQGAKDKPAELANYEVVDDITKLKDVDVAILATPTRSCPEYAEKIVALGINTVDSFDIHTSILDYRTKQMENCKKAGKVSVISAGWDPGSDSIVRVLMESLAPKGLTYTNFGPGMSMGHSVCVRGKKGVKEALSVTIPLPLPMRLCCVHRTSHFQFHNSALLYIFLLQTWLSPVRLQALLVQTYW